MQNEMEANDVLKHWLSLILIICEKRGITFDLLPELLNEKRQNVWSTFKGKRIISIYKVFYYFKVLKINPEDVISLNDPLQGKPTIEGKALSTQNKKSLQETL